MSPRTGRPKSENPKDVDIKIRVDKKTHERLTMCAEKLKTTRTDVIRKGIDLILEKQKE